MSDASQTPSEQPSKPSAKDSHVFQAPKGTRDFYPEDFARRKYIFDAWRQTALRHGFDEIDGPTFEHLDLYTAKSGEGIVSELFSFKRFGGEKDFALRPEFTPTLARMVAAKANALPKPIKWFSVANYFRAERPQRGRLREFAQWNCDILGLSENWDYEVELLAVLVDALVAVGFTAEDVRIKLNEREIVSVRLTQYGVPLAALEEALRLLDSRQKITPAEYETRAAALGMSRDGIKHYHPSDRSIVRLEGPQRAEYFLVGADQTIKSAASDPDSLISAILASGLGEWCEFDSMVIRGLAYYTGLVFEVHEAAGAERAIAGGGRYDKLVELFGGPATPAVGFAMGDVVLSLVLEDKGLMPKGAELFRKIGAAPDVFVITNGKDESEAALKPVLAQLRRGSDAPPSPNPAAPKTVPPLHARRSYKSTRNVGKLLKEAADSGARFAAILETASSATLKDLLTGAQEQDVPIDQIAQRIANARENTH